MGMLSFDDMDLSQIGVSAFDPADLYCLNDSPLQNQTLFPGCYGICAVRSPAFDSSESAISQENSPKFLSVTSDERS
jgi:hypothetical protein